MQGEIKQNMVKWHLDGTLLYNYSPSSMNVWIFTRKKGEGKVLINFVWRSICVFKKMHDECQHNILKKRGGGMKLLFKY